MTDAKNMALLACEALEDKKASDIKVIDIEQITTLADYFIIASGSNRNQVQAMADNVDEVLGKAGYPCKQTEGYSSANWILLDYGDIVIHLFDEENRLFYDLERIWRAHQKRVQKLILISVPSFYSFHFNFTSLQTAYSINRYTPITLPRICN